ncbi:hypothetical protein CLG94_01725 [Candidatus Methylomirabilis limnetica]|jgi:hypothetical protein|uniref:Predicted DNA-binding protein ribbon-helix-helix domain-containing protein n=1 Tax=Candidatus Methylomirabilis limnetica TaxID=2033718 RepID=A0A2T4U0Y9_9BACT|nr:ribbon-helix-helix domain-containing protein [Candidatus Methylomirabilis limnetica]PTL37009.1 hypothetical protein CLG94_01725 [Candidatus Methylomirabilis limnetica]
MPRKVRKQIYLDPHHAQLLKQLARDLGVSEAALIRQAVDQQAAHLTPLRRDPAAWQQERAFIERLIQDGTVPGRRTWKRDDLHER